jgi:hypothetical protein
MPERANTASDPSAEGSLAIVHSDSDYAIGKLDRYLISVWRSEITLRAAVHWGRLMSELRAACPGVRLASLAYIEQSCQFPIAPPMTQSFVEILKRYADVLGATAVVYNREGFWGAGVRSQVTSAVNESKAELPYFVAVAVEPAAAWLVQALSDSAPERVALLGRSMEQLRAAPVAASSNRVR